MTWTDVGGDPAPGDPDEIRNVANRFDNVSDTSDGVAKRLRAIAEQLTAAVWEGEAADSFARTVHEVLPDLDKMTCSYENASYALRSYADSVADAQDIARRAKADAENAIAERNAATSQQAAAHTEAVGHRAEVLRATMAAASTRAQAVADPANWQVLQQQASLHDDEQRRAQWYMDSSEQREQSAGREAAAANARLEAARRLAASARDLKDNAANVATVRLHEASEAGIQNRSFLERVADGAVDLVKSPGFDEFLNIISDIADVALAVAPIMPWVCGAIGMLGGPVGAAAGFAIGEGLTAAGLALKATVLEGRMAQVGVGKASNVQLLWAAGDLALSAVPLAKAGKEPAKELGGMIKRSLAYDDNRLLAGEKRVAMEGLTVAPKAADSATGSEYLHKHLLNEGLVPSLHTGVDVVDLGVTVHGSGEDKKETPEEQAAEKIAEKLEFTEAHEIIDLLRRP
jgi:WXG100 family type VII secretion target